MDIQKLITMGRLEREYELNGVTFHMVTPSADSITKITNNIELLTACITKIDDKQFLTDKDRDGLRTVLKSMQGAVIKNLADYADAMITEQGKLFGTEDDSKK
jgi:hypothetical protein